MHGDDEDKEGKQRLYKLSAKTNLVLSRFQQFFLACTPLCKESHPPAGEQEIWRVPEGKKPSVCLGG